MSSVVIAGDTSGTVTIAAPAVAGTTTLTLPSTSATLLTDSSGVLNIGSGQLYKDASGNVGIGTTTTTPTNGRALIIYETTYPRLTLRNSTTGQTSTDGYGLVGVGNDLYVENAEAGNLAFTTSNTERMRIDSNGRVMINGTDAASTWHYTGKFHVKSDAGSGSTVMSVRYAGTSAFRNVSLENDNGQVGYIQTSNSTTTYSTSSDYRLKENIAPMVNALNKVMQLNPVTFTWKSDGSDGQGFIAHELQSIIPDAVGGQKDGMREDGTPDYQGVDTSFLVATLTAAIKELKAELDTVKTELAILKGAA